MWVLQRDVWESYNLPVYARCLILAFILASFAFAQSPQPCPADRPVDDIIVEIHKQQSKKNTRNKNPLPTNVCIWGWCRDTSKPPNFPEPRSPEQRSTITGKTSSSRTAQDECLDAMDRAIDAAHNVEVGDYYFDQKNYKAAQLRYQDALDAKANDAAIHVRLGRAFEKLNDAPHAVEHYQAAEKIADPEKWAQEAHAALARLQH